MTGAEGLLGQTPAGGAAEAEAADSLPPLPMKLSRGYRPPNPDAPIDPATGVKYREGRVYLGDYWSIPMGGRYYLFERPADLLTDFYFRGGRKIIDFVDHDLGGNLPKFRVVACMAWFPVDPEGWEKFFVGKYTDTILEAVAFLRLFQALHIDHLMPQGFGIHRYNPADNSYMLDHALTAEIEKALKEPPSAAPADDSRLTFISSSSADYEVARAIYSALQRCSIAAFCAPISLPEAGSTEFSTAIDHAIENSHSLIVVASERKCFDSPWFDQEWRTWVNERRSGRKSGNILVLRGELMQVSDLPVALRFFETRRFGDFDDDTVRNYFR